MQFQSQVELIYDGQRVDAKSILNILTLAAVEGASVTVEAVGTDAHQAVEMLAALVESDFDNDQNTNQGEPASDGALRQQA